MAKRRTSTELNDKAFNYYLMLGLELSCRDVDKINAALAAKRSLWVARPGVGDRYVELLPDITAVMIEDSIYNESIGTYEKNKGGRDKEAQLAQTLLMRPAVEMLTELCRRGKLQKSELVTLSRNAGVQLSQLEAEFTRLFGGKIKLIDDTQTRFPFASYSDADGFLRTLSKKDYYDFLGLEQTASVAQIAAVNVPNPKPSSSQGTAISRLNALKKTLFATEADKAKYDYFLATRAKVWDVMALRRSMGFNILSEKDVLGYAQAIKQAMPKLSAQEIELDIVAGMREFKQVTEGKDEVKIEYCPYSDCRQPYFVGDGKKRCDYCKRPFTVKCWNCGAEASFTEKNKVCPTCKAGIDTQADFIKVTDALEQLLRKGEASAAKLQTELLAAQGYVPDYAAVPNSSAAKTLKKLTDEVNARVKELKSNSEKYDAAFKKLQELIDDKLFVTAGNVIAKLQKDLGAGNVALNKVKTIQQQALRLANAELTEAKNAAARNDEFNAVKYAARALALCADCAEATQIAEKYPPSPPKNVTATSISGTIKIEWEPSSNADNTYYTVIRKSGSAPLDSQDGEEIVTETALCGFEDKTAQSAVPYFYAVRAVRLGAFSPLSAVKEGVVRLEDVSELSRVFAKNGVEVVWKRPKGATVEVWKANDAVPPAKVGEGEKVRSNEKGFSDGGAEAPTGYYIVCKYSLGGADYYSKGIGRTFAPYAQLPAVKNAEIGKAADGSSILKIAAEGCSVKLYNAKKPPKVREKTTQPLAEFSSLFPSAEEITLTKCADGFTFTLPQERQYTLYPAVQNDEVFRLLPAIKLNTYSGVIRADVKEKTATQVTLSLHYGGAKGAILAINSCKGYAYSPDGNGEKTVSRQGKEVKIDLISDKKNYITLFVQIEADGQTAYSAPFEVPVISNLATVTVLYCLSYKKNSRKSFELTLKMSCPTKTEVENLILVKGTPRPLSAADGTIVKKLAAVPLKRALLVVGNYVGKMKIELPADATQDSYALFTESVGGHIKLKEVDEI